MRFKFLRRKKPTKKEHLSIEARSGLIIFENALLIRGPSSGSMSYEIRIQIGRVKFVNTWMILQNVPDP
jgi:hypothetical protein